jgi:two-component system sensor histidine kinase AlgZ
VLWVATLHALCAPRRAIPLGGVLLALTTAEWFASVSLRALAIDVTLFFAFCLLAPASWRWAAGQARDGRWLLGYVGFFVLGGVVVALIGLAPAWIGMRGTYVVDPPALGLVMTLFLVGGWGLGRDIDLEEGMESAERRADLLAMEAERARLLAMRAQLDPHFLFNTLNAIAEWCREDPALAEQATLKLASMLRAILDASMRPSWPLSREVALLEQLVDLYTVRDRERYRFVLEVPRPLPEIEIPPMLFLPLVENAITHGPSAGHAGQVRVKIECEEGAVALTIDNPGAYAGRREGGQGIAMVERRLALAYAGAATLSLRASDERTITKVQMPPLQPTAPT